MSNKRAGSIFNGQSWLHADLETAKAIYQQFGFEFTNFKESAEGKEYAACSFELDHQKVQYRASKITPTKTGQFVTIWKRSVIGLTEPFDISDGIDFIIISVRSGDNLGQFIFPNVVLSAQGIISRNGIGGKRGIRVYPPWDTPTNRQAMKTQNWQVKYFYAIKKSNTAVDFPLHLFEKQ
ncbi:MAG: hypothetical protein CFE23_14255 [Flavobacterium sp. BFFFF1]|uniref:MepB family protein n=1 Tax=Flavobacterium sp. BFFFF1 TaxID=2015557 RepID=UPI000BD3E10B|nr:MepB family protein [Flavobacterium sp. BFFFF1]OYU79396.1 MAG: hypothetical protein CFE23_14255 [Flavobacterium sp. BFFFF1]